MGETVRIKLSELKSHPSNKEIYGEITAENVSDLAESIRSEGLKHPVEVTPEGVILAGHRRVKAVKILGWKEVDAVVVEIPNADVESYIITDNNYREKTREQVTREYIKLKQIETKKAEQRRVRKPLVSDGLSVENSTHRIEGGNRASDIAAKKCSAGKSGETMDKWAEQNPEYQSTEQSGINSFYSVGE